MLGAIIGDIVGSVYEFNNYRHKDFSPFFNKQSFFTDDTICTVGVADALLRDADPAQTLQNWCKRYKHVGGWGNRFHDWIEEDIPSPYGSFGNGAAMRVSSVGLLASNLEEAVELSNRVTEITHNHPEGLRGAAATAAAIYWAKSGLPAVEIRHLVSDVFGYEMSRTVDDIRPIYSFNETCMETVPEALTCALEASSYEDAIRNAVSIGGDSDTVAAIAGGLAEALYGLPAAIAEKGWGYVPSDMRQVMQNLYEKAGYPLQLHKHLLTKDHDAPGTDKHCAIVDFRNIDYDDE
ncbi:ADP-ribosylglycohydrolase family protein [Zoogloea oleivorans]|uniref:ADP-ribosylglycohydrolase family protein n=1 Tax=Zoogloea oleivorans TaxID=1552750 RepID=A0A6C2C3C8_9RHOO|nr:ADP-ribosylglycohydrolase family protein [Zoogloea oleivorans]TYC48491.1 ADP-ribosylglycohydrolase family protein [Zoogloea oleivorans]